MNHALRTGVLYTGLVTTALVPQWQQDVEKPWDPIGFHQWGPSHHPWVIHGLFMAFPQNEASSYWGTPMEKSENPLWVQ